MSRPENWSWPPDYRSARAPADDSEFWSPVRETMDPSRRDEMILERLKQVVAYAYDWAPFYRRKWAEADFEPGDLKTFEDFEAIPVILKEDLRTAQAEHPPFGDYLCVPERDVVRVHGTSGTTGRPTAFGIGSDDWDAIANAHARTMWAMGVRPDDIVFVGSIFSLYMGSWGALRGAERLGAAAFPFGAGVPGQTLRAVNWMQQMRPSVFYGTPSYALRLAEVAEEAGVDARDFGIRILFFSGEPGAAIPPIRARIENLFGGRVFDSGSMAEMTPWAHLTESTGRVGMLCWQDIVYTEVADPQTFRKVPYGSEGTPIYTHLERTSQPMIRLLSGDLTRWEEGPSPCGRTYPHLPKGIFGRIDDQFTVRGENIYPSAIDEIVSANAAYGGEHRIIVSRDGVMDTLCVEVEYGGDASGGEGEDLFKTEISSALRTTLGVNTDVTVVPADTFERTEFKAHRVVDRRDVLRRQTEPA